MTYPSEIWILEFDSSMTYKRVIHDGYPVNIVQFHERIDSDRIVGIIYFTYGNYKMVQVGGLCQSTKEEARQLWIRLVENGYYRSDRAPILRM